jgi:16S rRNA (cytosine1402-N4)-methyltransferase
VTHSGGSRHIPVLLDEVVNGLAVESGGLYLDATVGGGGHASAILEASRPSGRLLGLDRDPEAVKRAARRLSTYGDRATVVHASYVDLLTVADKRGLLPLDGVLFDLGFSSWQIEDPARGFSFSADGPLDMRFDPTSSGVTAAELVNQLPASELADVLYEYGEETQSRRIAAAIVSARPIASTQELVQVIIDAVGHRRGRLHPATLTFQALRIAVNRELEGIEVALPQAIQALRPGGRLAVIAFHSLEDRIVKRYFRRESRDCICPPELPVCRCDHRRTVRRLTRKPIMPSEREIEANPRARSGRLRIVEKLDVHAADERERGNVPR